MSLNNSQMHGAALVATIVVASALFVVTFYAAQTVELPLVGGRPIVEGAELRTADEALSLFDR